MSRAGDPCRIGDDIGCGQEEGRYARLVGWLNRPYEQWDDGSRMRYLIRVYRPEDTTFPTGEYRRTGLLFPTEMS